LYIFCRFAAPLALCAKPIYSQNMLVEFTKEQEQQLIEFAAKQGIDPSLLVRNAALQLLADEKSFEEFIQVGIDQADRGELIESEEMDLVFAKLLRS
jgi:predicted transcriptional regulator